MRSASAVFALVLVFGAAGGAAAAPACFSKQEQRAHLVRQLQTELMVAALSCKNQALDLRGRYTAFVSKHGSKLAENADTLRSYFVRAHGKGSHMRQFDAYITALANEASKRSMGLDSFCEDIQPVFDKVLDVKDLESFAATTVKDHSDRCVAN